MILDAHAPYIIASYMVAAVALAVCAAIIVIRYRRALRGQGSA
jgi:heme exporter protein CcmD